MKPGAADVLALSRRAGFILNEGEAEAFVAPLAALLGELEDAARYLAPEKAAPVRPPVAVVRAEDSGDHGAFVHRFTLAPTGRGPLDGMTVGIKDTVAIAGVPRTRGRASGWDQPDRDAPVVERILAAGGTITGTLNLDAWCSGATGESSELRAIDNPRAPGRLAGGSSAGSGVALAACLVDLAIGTDTAGSARIPAAWCGVFGLKPSHGIVPSEGAVGLNPSLDAVCPMAASLDNCAAFFAAIADPHEVQPLPARRVAVVAGLEDTFDADCAVALEAALERFRHAGWTVTTVDVPLWRSAWQIESMLLATSVPHFARTGWQGRWTEATEASLPWDPHPTQLVALWMLAAEALGDRANDYHHLAATGRAALRRQTLAAFERAEIIVTPTTPTLPPLRAPLHPGRMLATTSGAATPVPTSTLTTPANLTGIPALAVPFGETIEGLPCSVQLHAPHGCDAWLFSAARICLGQ